MRVKNNEKKKHHPLDIFAQCRKYNLPLWQCPSFLIVPTGILNIVAIISTYCIATRYTNPEAVALMVIIVEIFFIIISYLIIRGFEKLAESNRLKSEFISIASHQLRTPLTGIKWAINLMSNEDGKGMNSEQRERIDTIKESNQRMINLINDLLNVSRIEQDRLGLSPEDINIKKIVQNIVKEHKLIAEANNIDLKIKIPEGMPKIWADPEGVKLVINNLLDNAIRYSHNGGTVTLRCKQQKKKNIRCEIEDEGVGIPKEDQNKIFKKFFRSENVMKYKTEGTGLGLFIAKAVVKKMGGKIDFQSREGKGTTFWFTLPIKKHENE
jgi:signal transduction histidine kinase